MGDQGRSKIIPGLRFLNLLVTILVFLAGLLILALGGWIIFSFRTFESEFYVNLMIIGSIFVCWSSLAFWCIYKGPPITMYIYGCFMACIIMSMLGVVGYGDVYRAAIYSDMRGGLNISLITSSPPNINLEFTQKTMKCCGVSNYTDWVRLSPQRVIPTSCCIDRDRCVTANYNDIYQQGCYQAIMVFIDKNFKWITITLCAVVTIPILGTVFACYLGFKLERERNRERILVVN